MWGLRRHTDNSRECALEFMRFNPLRNPREAAASVWPLQAFPMGFLGRRENILSREGSERREGEGGGVILRACSRAQTLCFCEEKPLLPIYRFILVWNYMCDTKKWRLTLNDKSQPSKMLLCKLLICETGRVFFPWEKLFIQEKAFKIYIQLYRSITCNYNQEWSFLFVFFFFLLFAFLLFPIFPLWWIYNKFFPIFFSGTKNIIQYFNMEFRTMKFSKHFITVIQEEKLYNIS